MDRFGWLDHPRPLAENWDQSVHPEDLVLVVGDISWATRPSEVQGDLAWLDERPGKKVLLKGNHDFWWPGSRRKLEELLAPFPSFVGFLHNGSALRVGPYVIAGVRGWTVPEAAPPPGVDPELAMESYQPHLVERDLGRLEASIAEAKRLEAEAAAAGSDPAPIRVACMHFPPVYAGPKRTRFTEPIEAFRPAVCVYGHLHGPGIAAGFSGELGGVRYALASCDAADFAPLRLI